MARAERAWVQFTDQDVEDDDSLIRLAECFLIMYKGENSFLKSVRKQLDRNYEISPKQGRAVLNHFIKDKRFCVPLMMYLNFGVKSPSDHLLTKPTIIDFALANTKERTLEVVELDNSFSMVTIQDVANTGSFDTEGRIFPKHWKINVLRKKVSTSTGKPPSEAAKEAAKSRGIHAIHTDSFIKNEQYYIVTLCGQYRSQIPDPFDVMEFVQHDVTCGKCLDSLTAPVSEE